MNPSPEPKQAPVARRRYAVRGMMCAACSARVERAARAVPGVASCAASLLTNELAVEGKGLILPRGGTHVVFLELRRHS